MRATLKALASTTAAIARVELRLPLDLLVRVEILDTPGFNAPDPRHGEIARAAFEEADVALWLLDVTQAMKQSERTVLEQAQAAGLPIQVLVNKADRLAPADLARVLAAVHEALGETRIASLSAPIAVSAKRALAGKLGDTAALAASGWPEVERLLADHIVSRSEELKERALRRRALALVGDLDAAWVERVTAEARAGASATSRAAEAARAVARLEVTARETAEGLARSLEPYAQAWSRDVELVFVGRDRAASERDPVLARYRVDRALATLAPALALALASLAPEADVTPSQAAPDARAIVRTAAMASPTRDALVDTIARAAVATWVERLSALSLRTPTPGAAAGVERELRAFAAAFAQR